MTKIVFAIDQKHVHGHYFWSNKTPLIFSRQASLARQPSISAIRTHRLVIAVTCDLTHVLKQTTQHDHNTFIENGGSQFTEDNLLLMLF